jgi:hypothetical protein
VVAVLTRYPSAFQALPRADQGVLDDFAEEVELVQRVGLEPTMSGIKGQMQYLYRDR